MDKLFAELGRLMVQAEILGVLAIPSQGQIGSVKARIAKALGEGETQESPIVAPSGAKLPPAPKKGDKKDGAPTK